MPSTTDAKLKIKERNDIIAFSAQLSTNIEVSDGSTIIFDNIIINEGELYDNTTGQFECLDDSVYVFMWSLKVLGGSSSRGFTSITQQGEEFMHGPQTSIYSLDSGTNGSSQMLVLAQCQTDPFTIFEVVSGIDPAPTYQNTHSSFSGYRLGPTDVVVGFSAELSQDVNRFLGSRIFFDNVISNFGGWYNSLHGFFQCPDDGLYSFTVSIHILEGMEQWSVSNLMFDGNVLLHGPITYRATDTTDSGSSSISILHQCEKSKDLYVEATDAYAFPYSTYGANLTTFPGYRICSDDCADLVAFSAVLSYNVTYSNLDIPFDNVRLNLGNAYNESSGEFTCPDELLYLFMWSGTGNRGSISLNLHFDLDQIGRLYYTRTEDYDDEYGTSGTSSKSVILQCSAGSTVTL